MCGNGVPEIARMKSIARTKFYRLRDHSSGNRFKVYAFNRPTYFIASVFSAFFVVVVIIYCFVHIHLIYSAQYYVRVRFRIRVYSNYTCTFISFHSFPLVIVMTTVTVTVMMVVVVVVAYKLMQKLTQHSRQHSRHMKLLLFRLLVLFFLLGMSKRKLIV